MALELNLSDDYLVWDRRELIRFESITRMGEFGGDDAAVIDAKRRAISTRDLLAANGAYTGADVNWFLPNALLPYGVEPKAGDIVTDGSGVSWTALEVRKNKSGNTWQLVSRSLAIVFDLRDLITIERRGVVYDSTGSPVSKWPTEGGKVLYTDLECRVHPQEQSIKEERGIKGREELFTIVLARNLVGFDCKECRIKYTSNGVTRILDAEKYHFAEKLGELARIEARWKVQ